MLPLLGRHRTLLLGTLAVALSWGTRCLHASSPLDGETIADLIEAESDDGWSPWGPWSACSRTCDGGVTLQSRRCSRFGCVGESTRSRICNMQPCPEHVDFRATQCSEFDQVPYRGRLYEWTPVHDASDPCSLTCQAREFKFMAKLAPRAQDGTRCRQGALDMCVQGKCLPVGCDLELGSYLEVDECGICGGNGTSCRAPAFTWSETPFSECSVTCGGGFQESHPVCTSSDTGSEVDDRLCNVDERPDSRVRKCNGNPCPPGWQMGAWGDCSASCGGGQQVRNVSCVRPTLPPVPVAEHFCPGQRPATSQSCNLHDCSRWTEGQWSQCSATCGVGTQTRAVECRDLRGRKSHLCDPKRKPRSKQQCSAGNPCFSKGKEYGSQEDAPPQSFPPFNIFSKPQNQSPGSEPSFIVGDWGSCSVTCGDGVQKRAVECKIFLEFSRTMAKLPDKECTGIRPAELQRCTMRPCAMDQNREALTEEEEQTDQGVVTTYSWRSAGYTPCTASCLGGIRESLVHCVRNEDGVPVSYIQCDIRDKPETITQTCNNRPCPPRWNTSDFTACSKPCGGGSQTRTVQCVHEVTRGVGNTLVVPDTHCPLPRPAEHRMCNMVDCVAHWTADRWAKCSKSCDGGVKTRKIHCQRELAYGTLADLPPSKCASKRKPRTVKPCNTKPCRRGNPSSVQGGPKRKVSLIAEGKASVFRGTTLKIRCPGVVANTSSDTSSRAKWLKDGLPVKTSSRRVVVSRKGGLRIRKADFPDAGTYVCSTGTSKSELVLSIRPLSSPPPDTSQGLPFDVLKGQKGHHPNGVGLKTAKGADLPSYINSVEDVQTNKEQTHSQDTKLDRATSSDVDRTAFKVDLASDQERNDQGLREVKGTLEDPTVNSGASSRPGGNIPRIQTLLSDFHRRLGGSGGGRDSAVRGTVELPPDDDDQLGVPNSYVLGRGNADNLQFEWSTTPWSACSQTCGGSGLQVRSTQCMVRLHNVSRTVDSTLCAGLEAPQILQRCGSAGCPLWVTGSWSQCSEGRCFTLSTSVQERLVECRLPDGTRVDEKLCDASTRPQDQQECLSERCRGVWKVGDWSECTATCGESGFRTRILRCVWYGTDKPAGDSCRNQDRPEVLQGCDAPPCNATRQTCEDHSIKCHMIRRFSMCHINKYHDLCCATCERS